VSKVVARVAVCCSLDLYLCPNLMQGVTWCVLGDVRAHVCVPRGACLQEPGDMHGCRYVHLIVCSIISNISYKCLFTFGTAFFLSVSLSLSVFLCRLSLSLFSTDANKLLSEVCVCEQKRQTVTHTILLTHKHRFSLAPILFFLSRSLSPSLARPLSFAPHLSFTLSLSLSLIHTHTDTHTLTHTH